MTRFQNCDKFSSEEKYPLSLYFISSAFVVHTSSFLLYMHKTDLKRGGEELKKKQANIFATVNKDFI
jgi:hypothetical protein